MKDRQDKVVEGEWKQSPRGPRKQRRRVWPTAGRARGSARVDRREAVLSEYVL